MEFKGKLNLDMKKANSYLSEQTISFGNKTVVTSALIILISLNFLTITGIEIGGITVSINMVIITILLQVVNFYYYQQFILSYDADNYTNIIGEDFSDFENELLSSYKWAEDKLKALIAEKESIQNEYTAVGITLERKKELLKRITELSSEFDEHGDIIKRSKESVAKEDNKMSNFLSIVKKYKILNFKVPQIIYFVGLAAVFFRFICYMYQIFTAHDDSWNYLWQDQLKYFKVIFESK